MFTRNKQPIYMAGLSEPESGVAGLMLEQFGEPQGSEARSRTTDALGHLAACRDGAQQVRKEGDYGHPASEEGRP